MSYFVMTCEGIYPSAALKGGPQLGVPPWMHGRVIDSVPVPLHYTLDPERPGNLCAMYQGAKYPLMSDELVAALQNAGVDNVQFFDAVIFDSLSGDEHSKYKAFNVVGIVSAADLEESIFMESSDSRLIDADFESLKLNEKKAVPFKLFRLAENVGAIIVDEVVKNEVEQSGIPGMVFYDPSDWSG